MVYHQKPERDRTYLAWIRQQPCCIPGCGNDVNVEAAHLRTSSLADHKQSTGMQQKSDDKWALPLCHRHHVEQHTMNEREFWASYGLDPAKLALRYQVMVQR